MTTKRVFQLFLIISIVLVSLAAAPRAHAWSACGGSYVVQRGDWLAKIARYCGARRSYPVGWVAGDTRKGR